MKQIILLLLVVVATVSSTNYDDTRSFTSSSRDKDKGQTCRKTIMMPCNVKTNGRGRAIFGGDEFEVIGRSFTHNSDNNDDYHHHSSGYHHDFSSGTVAGTAVNYQEGGGINNGYCAYDVKTRCRNEVTVIQPAQPQPVPIQPPIIQQPIYQPPIIQIPIQPPPVQYPVPQYPPQYPYPPYPPYGYPPYPGPIIPPKPPVKPPTSQPPPSICSCIIKSFREVVIIDCVGTSKQTICTVYDEKTLTALCTFPYQLEITQKALYKCVLTSNPNSYTCSVTQSTTVEPPKPPKIHCNVTPKQKCTSSGEKNKCNPPDHNTIKCSYEDNNNDVPVCRCIPKGDYCEKVTCNPLPAFMKGSPSTSYNCEYEKKTNKKDYAYSCKPKTEKNQPIVVYVQKSSSSESNESKKDKKKNDKKDKKRVAEENEKEEKAAAAAADTKQPEKKAEQEPKEANRKEPIEENIQHSEEENIFGLSEENIEEHEVTS